MTDGALSGGMKGKGPPCPQAMGHAGRQGGGLGAITAPCGPAGRGDAQAPGKVGQQPARAGMADLGGSGHAARASHVDHLQEWRLLASPFLRLEMRETRCRLAEGALGSPSLRRGHMQPEYWRFCNYPSGLAACSHTPSLSPLAWRWALPALRGAGGTGGACSFFRPWRRTGSLLSSALTKARGTRRLPQGPRLRLAVDPCHTERGRPGYAGTRPRIRRGVICTRVTMAHAHSTPAWLHGCAALRGFP